MHLPKRIALFILCCFMAAATVACRSDEELAMKKASSKVLKEYLAKYYGMEEGTYEADVSEIRSHDPRHVIWRVKSGEEAFNVYMDGASGYTEHDVFTDRYVAEFLAKTDALAEGKIKETSLFEGITFEVKTAYAHIQSVSPTTALPITLVPEKFDEFIHSMPEVSNYEGFHILIRVFTDAPFTMTRDQMSQLVVLPANTVTVDHYTGSDPTNPGTFVKRYIYAYDWGKKWEFDEERKEGK